MAETSTPRLAGSPVPGGPARHERKREKNPHFGWFGPANETKFPHI